MTAKKNLFEVNSGESTALQMLTGTKAKAKAAVQKEEEALLPTDKPKKKTNRGRKRKYEEGEMIKLTVLIDKHLSMTLKTLARSKGKTVRQIMIPLIEEWVETNHEVQNSYYDSKDKNYTGFDVVPELRQNFSEACTEREITQSFVMESLYLKAIEKLK